MSDVLYDHYAAPLSKLDHDLVGHVQPGGNWKNLPLDFPSARISQIRRSYAEGKGSRSTYYGRLEWSRPAYTVSTYFNRPGNGCFIHPEGRRLITLREGARLQSFPDTYRFVGSLRSRYMQIGNSVPPLLAYQLASALESGTLVDLFCGAGGLSLGFEWAGFQTILAVDNDGSALSTFRLNRSGQGTRALDCDLSSTEGIDQAVLAVRDQLGKEPPRIVVGGPPCQGFSTAGKCSIDDPRNQLMQSFLSVVDRLNPDYVLLENVAALLWRRNRHVLSEMRARLTALGYATAVMLGHAETFGVPQLRRRLFLLAARSIDRLTWPVGAFRMLRPSYPSYQMSCSTALDPPTVRDAIGDLPLEGTSSPDIATKYARPAGSKLQRWARGEERIASLPLSTERAHGGQQQLV